MQMFAMLKHLICAFEQALSMKRALCKFGIIINNNSIFKHTIKKMFISLYD